MIHLGLLVCSLPAESASQELAPKAPSVRRVAVCGEGGWNYLTVDPEAQRLYVPLGKRVVAIDLEKEAVVGELADMPGVHGITIVPAPGEDLIRKGGDDSVTVFDPKTLEATGRLKAKGVPDSVLYDPAGRLVITCGRGTSDATAIGLDAKKVVGTIDFGGKPEAPVADGRGHVFVNIRSTSEVAEFDAPTLKILDRSGDRPGHDARSGDAAGLPPGRHPVAHAGRCPTGRQGRPAWQRPGLVRDRRGRRLSR
jgi:hypothetical protein